MGINWTSDQQKTIDARGNNVLVSAAAGSGKTAVLSERIVKRIINERISIDEMLIMTFTNAAASEMKEKIKKRMEEALNENPSLDFLEEQIGLVSIANISTIHKFCHNVIHDYVYLTALSPDFRLANEGETELLKQDVLENVIEKYYESQDKRFLYLVESVREGRSDKNLENIILDIYNIARSYPNEREFFDFVRKEYNYDSYQEFLDSNLIKEIKKTIDDKVSEMLLIAKKIFDELEGEEEEKSVINLVSKDIDFFKKYLSLNDFEEKYNLSQNTNWGRLSVKNEEYKNYIKDLRGAYSGSTGLFEKLKKKFHYIHPQDMFKHMQVAKNEIDILMEVLEDFHKEFSELKLKKNIIDFADMEHFALDILSSKGDDSGEIADEYKEHFKEILIDEYQDTSFIQEAILNSISDNGAKKNRFMVGDVKQSIYSFRMSMPSIFTNKLERYKTNENEGISIDLSKNFRSRKEVLDSCNEIFYKTMIKEVGEVSYTKEVALVNGMDFPEVPNQNYKTEIHLISEDKENMNETEDSKIELEARVIANRIKELVGEFKVKGEEGVRAAKYSDIAVLLRVKEKWAEGFQEIFKDYGIPSICEKTKGYYDSFEIKTILNYLKVLDNPYNDIPLVAVMKSKLGGFNSEELAEIKSITNITNKEKDFLEIDEAENFFGRGNFYSTVKAYLKNGNDALIKQKIAKLFEDINKYRSMLSDMPLHKLLYNILTDTKYDRYVSSLPEGDRRKKNLDILIEEAAEFEKTSYQGLFYFVKYIEKMKKFEIDRGEAGEATSNEEAVKIMTIHKSKGLEFPIVFVAEIGKKLDSKSNKTKFHKDHGVAIKAYINKNKTLHTTILDSLISQKNKIDDKGERIRLLYVAMTRAKEKLILVGGLSNLINEDKPEASADLKWDKALGKKNTLSPLYIEEASSYADIVTPVAKKNKELFDIKYISIGDIQKTSEREYVKKNLTIEYIEKFDEYRKLKDYTESEKLKTLKYMDTYIYPNSRLSKMKPKFSVSYIKAREIEKNMSELFDESSDYVESIDVKANTEDELKKREDKLEAGANRGNAYHTFFEHLDYSQDLTKENILFQLNILVKKKIVSKEEADLIDISDIECFAGSDIGKEIKEAFDNGLLYRERPFVMQDSAKIVYIDALEDDKILIQGIIDLYYIKNNEIILIDYKTDNVISDSDLVKRYKTQLMYYKKALNCALELPVVKVFIYSTKLKKFVEID